MICTQCQELISDYIDGALELGEQSKVERHLADCEPCRAVRDDLLQIVHFSRQLPEQSPSAALWSRIQADIAEAEPAGFLSRASAWWGGLGRRHFNLSLPQMAASAAAIAIVISISVIVFRRDAAPSGDAATSGAQVSALAARPLSNPEVEQLEARINAISQSVEQRKAGWPEELRVAFDKNMSYVENTLAQCRHQLRDNPSDDVSQELMLNAYLEKLRVLEGFEKF
jgi:anti-sigma-K factor RskA